MLSDEITKTICNILSKEGCTACYLFGSQLSGTATDSSDIDIGIKGLAPQKFYLVHSMLEDATGKQIDLIDFDEKPKFFAVLQQLGELKQIG